MLKTSLLPRICIAFSLCFSLLACGDDGKILEKEEAASLQKSISVLKEMQEKTDAALVEKKHVSNFKKIRQLLWHEAKGELNPQVGSSVGWVFIKEKEGDWVAKKKGGAASDMVLLLSELVKNGQKGFLKSARVQDGVAEVRLTRWQDGLPPQALYVKGILPSFEDIKLGQDVKKFRLNPRHIVQPANAKLKDEADAAYVALKAGQEKLIALGHSQVMRPMMAVLQRLQQSPSSLAAARDALSLVLSDATSFKLLANDRGLLVERSLPADKGASIQKKASEAGFFLEQVKAAESLRFLVVRKDYKPIDLAAVVEPAQLGFEQK